MNKVIATETHTFHLTVEEQGFRVSLSADKLGDGRDLILLRLEADEALTPSSLTLRWSHPACDIQGSWHPAHDRNKSFKADWMRGFRSNAAASAPVHALFNSQGSNRLTFAYSDALNTVHYAGAISEETAEFHCKVQLFVEETAPFQTYEAKLLVDTRDVPYYESLRGVGEWWSRMPEYTPAFVPHSAKEPMYSTWYSMHQRVTDEHIEQQCLLAKKLGMEAVIVDDGWQTEDHRRGYAYCGDWEAYDGKFPDMKRHVDAVHTLGMKFILWYSVPFIGKYSKAWDRFKDKILRYNDNHGAAVLDPRFPDVREYIIQKYEEAVTAWGLDGFKLDFIDTFYSPEQQLPSQAEGKDYESIPAAVDRLLTDSIGRLRELNPDIMIEFRQMYVGPAMRKYGNMFRASDCPNDSTQNRVRTIDIRLICGDTAAHADMIMWHPEEPVESAALQLINCLFSVPQVSVLLDKLPDDHLAMLAHYLVFWKEHRALLLDGSMEPMNPELLYPLVRSVKGDQGIVVTYYDSVVPLPTTGSVRKWIVVNGRRQNGMILDVSGKPTAACRVIVQTCTGDIVEDSSVQLAAGLHKLDVPASGMATLYLL
ncbi:glycoside hydrolase family 36 protein [Paenibacillus sp. GCM10023248]|uniref:glycoside hydrolase family 36 protein n=1 Tax=unclassified Paenibacillus TaxID=185978 RepID=UPI00237898BF|nr:glycoside hydrolase family 36 protein [Paenibacillus sp. MAHUQ-63]MDD9269474.1 alpha-galactosidase [Paenibacillus sp. MAHUQ-63]